jgi:hypothetical protein
MQASGGNFEKISSKPLFQRRGKPPQQNEDWLNNNI